MTARVQNTRNLVHDRLTQTGRRGLTLVLL
jgi:hypothetical protein